MTDANDLDRDAAEKHFAKWYPDTAWGFDALVNTLAEHRMPYVKIIEELTAKNAALVNELKDFKIEQIEAAYNSGSKSGDRWSHMFISDGEWLCSILGFNPKQGWYPISDIRSGIDEYIAKL